MKSGFNPDAVTFAMKSKNQSPFLSVVPPGAGLPILRPVPTIEGQAARASLSLIGLLDSGSLKPSSVFYLDLIVARLLVVFCPSPQIMGTSSTPAGPGPESAVEGSGFQL